MATLFQFLPGMPQLAVLNALFAGAGVPLHFRDDAALHDENHNQGAAMQQPNEKHPGPEQQKDKDPVENLQLYLMLANLPPLELGHSAPPLGVLGHRMHLNKLAVAPSQHRARFEKILPPNKSIVYQNAVLKFCNSLIPGQDAPLPDGSPATGYMLSMASPRFNIPTMGLLPPNSLNELALWFTMVPFQTMTRLLHLVFPTTRGWDFTFVPYALQFDRPVGKQDGSDAGTGPDPDGELWCTYVWRKRPEKKMELERYYRVGEDGIGREEILGECKVVMAVQPPWICSEADLKAFVKTTEIQPYNVWDPEENLPYKSGERIWAKLWDTCARHRCRHWVLSTYHGWVFGAFSEGFSAGQIFTHLPWDISQPTVLQCLVYHVASAMELADNIVPFYPEPVLCIEEMPKYIPPSDRNPDIEYPDSGSDWDGMDDEPDISAGCSQYFAGGAISAWGSQQACELPYNPVRLAPRPLNLTETNIIGEIPHYNPVFVTRMPASRTNQIFEWHEEVRESREPEAPITLGEMVDEVIQRLPSPTPSEALTNVEIFESAAEPNTDLVMTMETPWSCSGKVLFGIREAPEDDNDADDEMNV
ncbi:hypothetical protein M422DRAFT_785790 [Sphaerobolus stellatus SS14]|uniref:Uncharacterized protein n=1 Tax=Sphaerobolus stellatus (strain SS14) TaxID=990650 RepID=A0A0C9TS75_SPHS4|nr:hypothetical protein M422DRAFT_785790 [Sphaerobolus stellatus SS14]